MWCLRAPIALRMPISRVRSVTVTSMMFITPMPPTSSEIAATAPSSTVNTEFEASLARRQRRLVQHLEVGGRHLVVSTSSVELISVDAASEAPRDFACTVIWLYPPVRALSESCTEVTGAIAMSS